MNGADYKNDALDDSVAVVGIALLSPEGSGIAKRIPRGVVPTTKCSLWNHPAFASLRYPS